MEEFSQPDSSAIRVGVLRMYSNLVVIYMGTETFSVAAKNASIQVISRNKSFLDQTAPDVRIPKYIRSLGRKRPPNGVAAGYLFFLTMPMLTH